MANIATTNYKVTQTGSCNALKGPVEHTPKDGGEQ